MSSPVRPPACDTLAIKAPFAPTGGKTLALDHFDIQATDYKREAAYYSALMNWALRSDDGTQAVLDIGDEGSVVIRGGFQAPPPPPPPTAAELTKRGLNPVADNDGRGFESFHVEDPDALDVQITNGAHSKTRASTPATATHSVPAPFESTTWKTVWLDHISFVIRYRAVGH